MRSISCSISSFERASQLHLLELLAHLFVEQVAVQQSLLDGVAQVVQRLLAVGQIVEILYCC